MDSEDKPKNYLTATNLTGSTVRDLIEALSLIDPDTRTSVHAIRVVTDNNQAHVVRLLVN